MRRRLDGLHTGTLNTATPPWVHSVSLCAAAGVAKPVVSAVSGASAASAPLPPAKPVDPMSEDALAIEPHCLALAALAEEGGAVDWAVVMRELAGAC